MDKISFSLLRKVLLEEYLWTFTMVEDLRKQLKRQIPETPKVGGEENE